MIQLECPPQVTDRPPIPGQKILSVSLRLAPARMAHLSPREQSGQTVAPRMSIAVRYVVKRYTMLPPQPSRRSFIESCCTACSTSLRAHTRNGSTPAARNYVITTAPQAFFCQTPWSVLKKSHFCLRNARSSCCFILSGERRPGD